MIIENVRDFFKTCPYLEELSTINVDFLDKDEGSYSIEPSPARPKNITFIDGSSEKQYLFILSSREFYSTDQNRQNIDNLNLYENIENWIEEKNRQGDLPNLGGNRQSKEINILTYGYLFSVDSGMVKARYQMQLSLNYIEWRN